MLLKSYIKIRTYIEEIIDMQSIYIELGANSKKRPNIGSVADY